MAYYPCTCSSSLTVDYRANFLGNNTRTSANSSAISLSSPIMRKSTTARLRQYTAMRLHYGNYSNSNCGSWLTRISLQKPMLYFQIWVKSPRSKTPHLLAQKTKKSKKMKMKKTRMRMKMTQTMTVAGALVDEEAVLLLQQSPSAKVAKLMMMPKMTLTRTRNEEGLQRFILQWKLA